MSSRSVPPVVWEVRTTSLATRGLTKEIQAVVNEVARHGGQSVAAHAQATAGILDASSRAGSKEEQQISSGSRSPRARQGLDSRGVRRPGSDQLQPAVSGCMAPGVAV